MLGKCLTKISLLKWIKETNLGNISRRRAKCQFWPSKVAFLKPFHFSLATALESRLYIFNELLVLTKHKSHA